MDTTAVVSASTGAATAATLAWASGGKGRQSTGGVDAIKGSGGGAASAHQPLLPPDQDLMPAARCPVGSKEAPLSDTLYADNSSGESSFATETGAEH